MKKSKAFLKDKLSGLKEYFQQTTVHGIRYVVDGETIIERLVWVLTMAIAFACAAYLTYSSVVEAEEHPIATTTEVLTINNIPFPAVTVAAGGGHERTPPFRLVADILNAARFDCTKSDENCLQTTKKVRNDFAPLIRSAINIVYAIWLKEISEGSSATDWIKKETLENNAYASDLMKAFCEIDYLAFNSSETIKEDMLSLLQVNFMVDRELYQDNTLNFVKNLKGDSVEAQQCTFETLKSSMIKASLSTMLLLHVKAYESMPSAFPSYLGKIISPS